MKRQRTPVPVVQPNLRRLLLLCTVALVLLAFALPALAQDLPEGKTAEPPKDSVTAPAVSGLEASLGTAAPSSPKSQATCLSVSCLITCKSGLSQTRSFTDAVACYSYSDAYGCHSSGFYVCSDKPVAAGC
ncbi:MAG: hypothetical protein ACJ76Y_24945 [Thermoanaerobaculia bacterium]